MGILAQVERVFRSGFEQPFCSDAKCFPACRRNCDRQTPSMIILTNRAERHAARAERGSAAKAVDVGRGRVIRRRSVRLGLDGRVRMR
jgi:hypothetical protein